MYQLTFSGDCKPTPCRKVTKKSIPILTTVKLLKKKKKNQKKNLQISQKNNAYYLQRAINK